MKADISIIPAAASQRCRLLSLGVGCAGVPGLRGGARLGGEDCGVGGGRPRREKIEHKQVLIWSRTVLKARSSKSSKTANRDQWM